MTGSPEWLRVESLDMEAQGVARNAQGKVVFIEGALPGEEVTVSVIRRKNQWEQATPLAWRRESSQRVTPACPHYGTCGGCKMQHLHVGAQLAIKQRALEDTLWHIGKVRAERMLRPIEGPTWGYRFRGRLSVRYVVKKGKVLIGFHERKSSFVADMGSCEILPAGLSALLLPLRELISGMDERDRLPQIEFALGDATTALVLRHLQPLGSADLERLRAFGARHHVQWWLQAKGPDSAQRMEGGDAALAYKLPEFGIEICFTPTDFTQVNSQINRVLVESAIRLLDPQRNERVIDWFCGLGNFTLPIATLAREVLGVEGSDALVQRARDNALRNSLQMRSSFVARNLFDLSAADLAGFGHAHKWLIDPPREGAFALVKALADLHENPPGADGEGLPQRIVYVSCNPATLARDAGLLVHRAGYLCTAAGAVNMFPHTAHVESIAMFERGNVTPEQSTQDAPTPHAP
ncbi:MAG: 23S rRNA (uracil(1939)-C(5))-methyltransferase RlmD [Burkholderiales bacterium]|nr:23S rRNA (uracil(1939)-C(5))-methyltransferase RlmD [Burkholderiales bacterium]